MNDVNVRRNCLKTYLPLPANVSWPIGEFVYADYQYAYDPNSYPIGVVIERNEIGQLATIAVEGVVSVWIASTVDVTLQPNHPLRYTDASGIISPTGAHCVTPYVRADGFPIIAVTRETVQLTANVPTQILVKLHPAGGDIF